MRQHESARMLAHVTRHADQLARKVEREAQAAIGDVEVQFVDLLLADPLSGPDPDEASQRSGQIFGQAERFPNVAHRAARAVASDDRGQCRTITPTRRQLARIVLVAVECGSRFQRDAIHHDPLAWMFTPRRIFDGASPVDAVMELENCERAIILHGLGMLDGDIEFIDDLRSADDEEQILEPEGQDLQAADSVSGRRGVRHHVPD